MLSTVAAIIVPCLAGSAIATVYSVPKSPPSNASPQLDSTPLGISIEFFTFPQYMNAVNATAPCIQHLSNAMGGNVPIRIGGASQDRATYDASLASPVSYTSANPTTAPSSLTYGPSFMSLAATLSGDITIGFNRKENKLQNTIDGAKVAKAQVKNLFAIELGNEPDGFFNAPVATAQGGWSSADEAANERSWQASVCKALGTTDLIQAGNFASITGDNIAELAPAEGSSLQYVKTFSGHQYAQTACDGKTTDLSKLMSHSVTVSFMTRFKGEVKAANAQGKPYYVGETNSVSCSGGTISPQFGAALWIIDYSMSILITGAKRLYFHQGTIGACLYCWWGTDYMFSPYYGAYFVAEAISGADNVAMIDDGKSQYAVYIIYKGGNPVRAILYNSDVYSSGTRSQQTFTLSGVSGSSLKSKRLTAPAASSRQDQGSTPTYGGQVFGNGSCAIKNSETMETTVVSNSSATFSVGASEALLVFL